VEERGVLRHHADLCPERILRDVRDIVPIQQDGAAFGFIEAKQQVCQRRLARAGAADEPDFLPGRIEREKSSITPEPLP
jgi:hypothetical protein